MKLRNLFNPAAYKRFIISRWYLFNLRIGRPFTYTSTALGERVIFYVSSGIELGHRARGSYISEKSTMEWIEKFVGLDDTVYDIGANVGAYSLLIGKRMKTSQSEGKVYGFEPEASNFFSLNRNVMLNGLDKYVVPVPLAFGDRLKLGTFYLSSNEPGDSLHSLDRPYSDGKEFTPAREQGIISMALDQFVRLPGVQFPNHIKLDVDGYEGVIVENGETVLKDPRLKTIIIEVDGANLEEIQPKMVAFGFSDVYTEELKNQDGYMVSNVLYVRERP